MSNIYLYGDKIKGFFMRLKIASSAYRKTRPPRNDEGEQSTMPSRNGGALSWLDNPDIQRLLDVVSSIIAEEYIEVAKNSPEVFKNGGEQ